MGLTLWALGASWVGLAWRGLLPPASLGLAVGGVVALAGAQVTAVRAEGAGLVLGLATAAALLVGGTTGRRFVLAGVGVVGVFAFLPSTVGLFFAGTLAVPVVILAAGAVLLAVAGALLRSQARHARAARAKQRPGEPADAGRASS